MKKISILSAGVFITFIMLFFASCQKDSSLVSRQLSLSNAGKGSANSTSAFGDYNIVTSVSTDGKVWTYTITRARANAKNLSHLIINLQNCTDPNLLSATFANITSATLNGAPANLSPSEGQGTGCDPQATTLNFVKINFTAATSWVLVITYERGYETFATATAWVKAGTSCNMGTIAAPGCPKQDYCSFSQGYFFAPGSVNNGALTLWNVSGLTIGGINYTHAQGRNFWDIDRGRGGNQGMNAFFALGAARLSGVGAQVAADAAIIDAYFTGLNVSSTITLITRNGQTYYYFNLPATNNLVLLSNVVAAGSRINDFIDANHCL